MNVLQGALLGAVQGLTEFLPVSSSGHLALMEHFMDIGTVPFLFDISLHMATLVAVLVVFRSRIAALLAVTGRFLIRRNRPEDAAALRLILALLVATAVTGVIGLTLKDLVSQFPIPAIAVLFLVTALILVVSDRIKPKNTVTVPGIPQALCVGLAQGLGVMPGLSRSGSTIGASLLCGLDRKEAGEFSFLLSIPAILAAFILELKDADTLLTAIDPVALAAGVLTAFLVGLLALKLLLTLIRRGRLSYFAFYLVPLGISVLVLFYY